MGLITNALFSRCLRCKHHSHLLSKWNTSTNKHLVSQYSFFPWLCWCWHRSVRPVHQQWQLLSGLPWQRYDRRGPGLWHSQPGRSARGALPQKDFCMLCCHRLVVSQPVSAPPGLLWVFSVFALQRAANMIPAHDSPLAALAFDASGIKLATASEKVNHNITLIIIIMIIIIIYLFYIHPCVYFMLYTHTVAACPLCFLIPCASFHPSGNSYSCLLNPRGTEVIWVSKRSKEVEDLVDILSFSLSANV